MKTKTCLHCKRKLPATNKYFYKDDDGKDGLENSCRECRNEYHRKRRNGIHDDYSPIDPIIKEPTVKIVPGAGCTNCPHEWDCRELVLSGRQVLCSPVHQSDLLLERAYAIRNEERMP